MNIILQDVYYSSTERVPIINSFEFNCQDVGIYHFLGPNGIGKSTIFKALNGELNTKKALVKNKK